MKTLAQNPEPNDKDAPPRRHRQIRQPSAVPVAPLCISQVNCEAAVGLKPWRFLSLLVEENVPHLRRGQLRLVDASVLLAYLRTRDEQAEAQEPIDEADRVLAAIGRRRAP